MTDTDSIKQTLSSLERYLVYLLTYLLTLSIPKFVQISVKCYDVTALPQPL